MIARGYLVEGWALRERVDTSPVVVPEELMGVIDDEAEASAGEGTAAGTVAAP